LLGGEGTLGVSVIELATRADPIVTLGGDGTLLGVARNIDGYSPTFVGVNFGNLGFLTEIKPEELFPVVEQVLAGTAPVRERSMLLTEVLRGESIVFSSQAVNDAVIMKGARSRLIDLDFYVDNEAVMRLRADGLIVATPTGSTAYSLAAGGSIVSPSLAAVLVTPICPHSLTSRPLVLDLEAELKITVPQYDGRVFLTVDGQVSLELQTGDTVRIRRAKQRLRFVRSLQRSYFSVLRTKLNWGIPNRGD
jgi:NAD+ kinase